MVEHVGSVDRHRRVERVGWVFLKLMVEGYCFHYRSWYSPKTKKVATGCRMVRVEFMMFSLVISK